MKLVKMILAALALGLTLITPLHATAGATLTDEEYMEFNDALQNGDVKIVKKYVDNGLDVNAKYFGWSALQVSANKGRLEVVKYLSEHGADLNYVHPLTKMTAFHLAAYDGFNDIVKYLAENGADINKKMRGGVSLIRVVKGTGNTKMVELLTSLGVSAEGCEGECL